ncbi:unnamed protein product [Dovyalis caffra]|uniref:Uncharacterized protein n=1 Tax=Dovyalis caffra TaxID=77055 RepID=A0AAV1QTY8_9ROSI|nr:unnamed protein product [Dovyalis caffra]
MDMHGHSQHDSGKLEQIISQFLLKSLHIILDSRIPSLHPHDRSGDLSSISPVKKSDKWFNLVLGDRPAALDNLNFWHRNLMDPMIIDVILVHQTSPASSSMDNLYAEPGTSVETVIERWVVHYESLRVMPPQTGESSASYKKTYKKSIILLRSLYSHMRLLPAYRIFRQLSSSNQSYNFDIIYKVSSFCEPFSRADEEVMKELSFVPVEALPGRLCVSVTYRSTLLSDFKLEPVTTMPPKIIMDYVGSPTTDPLRSFPSSEKGVGATSFPLIGMQTPVSSPFQRPHSWSSGYHRAAHLMNQPLGGSPPAYRTSRMSCDFPSPPTDIYGHRAQNYRPPTPQKGNCYDEYQLSPPFSPLMSPSTPTHFYSGSPVLAHVTSETAPVTIPFPISGRSSRYLSPNFSDSSRHSLPPLSPRSTRHDSSSQESPSGIRSIKKSEAIRFSELNSGNVNHCSGQKLLKDSKDDSGRFSGLLSSSGSPRFGFSRSSSRLSFQDDLDDDDFSCPFDVDDVDTSDSHASQNLDGKKNLESSSHTASIGKKSQDAAVGILVHMLRTAPPLRQDPSCYSSQSLRTDIEEGIGTASGFFMPRKTADALEELRSYRDMKDLLLSKSGTRVTLIAACYSTIISCIRNEENIIEENGFFCRVSLLSSNPSSVTTSKQYIFDGGCRHANSHFEKDDDAVVVDTEKDEQLARDLKLAQQLSIAPPSSTSTLQDNNTMGEKISCLIALQNRSSFYHVKTPGGLISLLSNCFELDADARYSTVLLSGYVDHFQTLHSEDVGWGCGWRNIQMLSSHLLSHRQDAREVLFGGSGFVPDIPFLQRWLEIAWEKGFDPLGSHHFNNSVYGSKHWIGTTECAALFRSFGLRARIVDFGPKELQSFFLSVPGTSLASPVMTANAGGKRKAFQVYGPMDRYLLGRNGAVSQLDSVVNDKSQLSTGYMAGGSDHSVANKFPRKNEGHKVLLDWVWNYFSEESLTMSAQNQHVVITNRPPLYFQHDGHSRTIVGIQVRRQENAVLQYNLLILDPAHRTVALERSLKENAGWKKLIKRGVHTLKKPQYQLCYIDPGIAIGDEMEQLKKIDSVFIEF